MFEDSEDREKILGSLREALEQWTCHQNGQPLSHWLAGELDSRGTVSRLPIADWHVCLENLRQARAARPEWPSGWDQSIANLVIATVRYSRPDGSPAAEFNGRTNFTSPDEILRHWMNAAPGTETANRLLEWRKSRTPDLNFVPDPPAWDVSNGVLSVLRDQVNGTGDFIAVDHRQVGPSCRFELFGSGRSWLGPWWTIDGAHHASERPRPLRRVAVAGAEIAEWSHRMGDATVTQTILLLGGRRLALLSALLESRAVLSADLGVRLAYPPSVTAQPLPHCRGFRIGAPARGASAQVLSLGLPCLPYDTPRGALLDKDSSLSLTQAPAGRRCWLPLLVSWDPARNRRQASWRMLTVSERFKAVSPDRAFAARISWGRRESYVVYRSLGPAASRAFLGHRTHSRFLIGLFTPDGNVTPIVQLD